MDDGLQLRGMIDSFSLIGEAAGKLGFFTIGALGLLAVATDLAATALVTGRLRRVGMTVLSVCARCCLKGRIFAMIVVVVGSIIIGAVAVAVVEPALVRRGLVVHGYYDYNYYGTGIGSRVYWIITPRK